jgi:hypothetical protein
MIQLSYQQAFDPFHAVYRLLRLRNLIRQRGHLHVDAVRILDFYLLFPFRADAIRLAPQHRRFKKLSFQYESTRPYGAQPEDRTIFERMEPMQTAALETLAVRHLIDPDELIMGRVTTTSEALPEELAQRIEDANGQDAPLMDFLSTLASDYDLIGPHGLKARTGLLEHRYDAI